MEELINQLVAKTGIDRDTAMKVADFIKNHAAEIPGWLGKAGLGGLEQQAEGLLGNFKL